MRFSKPVLCPTCDHTDRWQRPTMDASRRGYLCLGLGCQCGWLGVVGIRCTNLGGLGLTAIPDPPAWTDVLGPELAGALIDVLMAAHPLPCPTCDRPDGWTVTGLASAVPTMTDPVLAMPVQCQCGAAYLVGLWYDRARLQVVWQDTEGVPL